MAVVALGGSPQAHLGVMNAGVVSCHLNCSGVESTMGTFPLRFVRVLRVLRP